MGDGNFGSWGSILKEIYGKEWASIRIYKYRKTYICWQDNNFKLITWED